MTNSAPLFLALRYMRPKRSFVSVITIVSILGIAVGVLMMIVVRSVMQGFEVDFRNTLIAAEPHALFSAPSAKEGAPPVMADWQKLAAAAKQQPGVLSATPFAGGVVYVEFKGRQTDARIFGLRPHEAAARLDKVRKSLLEGALDLADGTLVIGDSTASQHGLALGDEVDVYPDRSVIDVLHRFRNAQNESDADKKNALLKQIKLKPLKLRIAGVVRDETGGFYSYCSLSTGQEIFRLGDAVSGVAVELAEPEKADVFAKAIATSGAVPAEWKTTLWTSAGEARLAAMGNEQIMMRLILAIIALIAAFSVMNTTITVTTQKRREIGVLTAIGGAPNQITSIFVIQGAIVGALGTLLGLISSFIVLHFRDDIRAALTGLGGGHVNAVDGVFLATIPAQVRADDVALTCVLSLAMCLIAALIPAFFAARLDPAVALRD